MRFVVLIVVLFAVTATVSAAGGAENRLGGEASPYLLLHKDDPVHWRPWGPDALAEARRDGKLIFLSIGYSACHWCHVMQRDNFEDRETADLMNERFINILLDREEHPDVDNAYVLAAANLGLPTGWPLNLVLTPDAKPIFGGTYFPPERRQGLPAFTEMLLYVARRYVEDPSGISKRAAANFELLAQPNVGDGIEMSPKDLRVAGKLLLGGIDVFHGGFGESAKFPFIPALAALWRTYLRSGDQGYRDAVVMTMESMVLGGLYDHIGGGFARYTEDPAWEVPHFEKMLYVNGQMLAFMTEVWRETRSPLLEARIRETVGFMLDELRLKGGGFAAALDSDSVGPSGDLTEGGYYVWSVEEIDAVLGPEAEAFKRAFGVTDEGNWHGTNVLLQSRDEKEVALNADLAASRRKLAVARARRPRPMRDDKVLADWNGIVIAALTEAGAALGETVWIEAARDAFEFVVREMSAEDRLAHTWRVGRSGPDGLLDDYAQMAHSALTLFEYTGEASFLDRAKAWVVVAEKMWDEDNGAYYASTSDADTTGLRLRIGADDQLPSGNAVIAEVLARLYYLTGVDRYRARAARIVVAFRDAPLSEPRFFGGLLRAADTLNGAIQVVVVGDRKDAAAMSLVHEVWRASLPGRALEVIENGAALPLGHPAFGKTRIDGAATAYVCIGTFCSLPVQSPDALRKAMHDLRRI